MESFTLTANTNCPICNHPFSIKDKFAIEMTNWKENEYTISVNESHVKCKKMIKRKQKLQEDIEQINLKIFRLKYNI